MSIYKRLSGIQVALKAPKGQYNSFGKYKYRNCEDILEAVKPLLNGLSLTITDSIELVGDRYYVKATADLSGGDNEGSVYATAYAREPLSKKGMDESQITGSASSYARKYALNGLFAIDDSKDADSFNNSDSAKKPNKDMMPEYNYTPTQNDWDSLNYLMQCYANSNRSEVRNIFSQSTEEQKAFYWANIEGIEGGDPKTTIKNNIKEWIK